MRGSKRRYEQLQPQLQRDIAADYRRGVRGHGLRALANTYQLPIPTVQHVIARATRPGGDPVAPRGHKRRKLNEVDEAKLCRTLERNAFATNRDLAAVVGNKISERSVSVYLARAKPRFTAKVVQDQEPEELSEEWKTEAKQWLEQVKRIPLDKGFMKMKPRSMQTRLQRKAAPAGANPYFAQGRGMQKNTRCICMQKEAV